MRVEARHPLLVLRLSALGDVIHTIPAVAAIRRSQPGFAIGWVVEKAYADLVETVAPVDRVLPVDLRGWRREPFSRQTRQEFRRAMREIRQFARGGTAIDFQGLVKSALIGKLSKAKERIGLGRGAVREPWSTWLTNRHVDVRESGSHVIQINMRLAEGVGAQPIEPLTVDFSHYARDRSGRLSVLMQSRPVLLLPGVGRSEKHWPTERFAVLAEMIRTNLGREVVVAWGPGEEGLARELAARTPVVRVAPPTDLRELAYLLGHASLVIGADTGPLHLAAALKTKVVGLYGPTNPERNGPWRQLSRVVESWSGSRRMDEISVQDVMRQVTAVLEGTPR